MNYASRTFCHSSAKFDIHHFTTIWSALIQLFSSQRESMAENKELLGGLYVQENYDVDGTPESVSTCFVQQVSAWFIAYKYNRHWFGVKQSI